ncbi:hypothetical protein L0B70_00390 [Kaistella sp. 97-N-M2]|uniref:hypothetical protein n=1 Tax=Kaistella sp. 97-N-M2 TaxID=2908645 RepID=UPI001F3D95B0|nr:hypothetical protein [Kaistella sp. 97-N-M2]UJF29886.1 hypothetical protein L0B70_00390 [Kaistella sp. 97-N-M2]
MTLYDLTLLEGTVLALNVITATSYLALAINIRQMRGYLRWNKHIYPTMMWGSLVLSLSLFRLLVTYYFFEVSDSTAWIMVFIFLGMMAIGYAVAAEAKRLAHKYDRLQAQDKEITHLKGIIELMKKNKIIIMLGALLFLVNCGGMKKEISRLTEENKTKTEQSEKRISELTAKISEVEKLETETKTELHQKTTEISELKKEKSELQESLEKKDRTDFSVKNPTGPIKITDTKGNQYEFEGGAGTEINNSSESTLSTTIKQLKETVQEKSQRVQFLVQSIFQKDNVIKQKNAEIKDKESENKNLKKTTVDLYENLQKEKTRTGTPIYYWIGAGMMLMILLQLAWKILWKNYGPGIIDRFKNGKIQ